MVSTSVTRRRTRSHALPEEGVARSTRFDSTSSVCRSPPEGDDTELYPLALFLAAASDWSALCASSGFCLGVSGGLWFLTVMYMFIALMPANEVTSIVVTATCPEYAATAMAISRRALRTRLPYWARGTCFSSIATNRFCLDDSSSSSLIALSTNLDCCSTDRAAHETISR